MKSEKDVQPIRNQQQLDDMKWTLKRHCSERDYILFILGCETGLRIWDLLRLTTATDPQATKRSHMKLHPRSNVTICVIGEKAKFDDYQSFLVHIFNEEE